MIGKLFDSPGMKRLSQRSDFVRWLYEARQVWWDLPAIKEGREGGRLYPLYLDYVVNAVPRYGYGKPVHEGVAALLSKNRAAYAETTRKFLGYRDQLRAIPYDNPVSASEPFWGNGWIHGMDMVALYCMPSILNPSVYLEVGSGNSTKFVRKAIQQNGLKTKMVSIDPQPRAEIDSICDRVIRQPLENVDLTVFDELGDGDILMIDSSHRCFQNSDVTALFLEVLPRLKSGVVIHIHDIFLPFDYPPEWKLRYYSEQYLLAVLLLADKSGYDVLYPCRYMLSDESLRGTVDELWDALDIPAKKDYGSAFWMRVNH